MWLTSALSMLVLSGYLTNVAYSHPAISASSRAQRQSQLVHYLSKYGYLPTTREGNSVDYTNALPSAINKFQTMARLPRTGELDKRTMEMMNQPRCGVKDPVRRRRYAYSGNKWSNNTLTWGVRRFATHLSHAEVLNVFGHAFRAWSRVTNLHFEYRSTGFVDIEVKFVTGSHDDGYRFDGDGGILAHAFYPPGISTSESNSIAGDLHFDDEESWVVNLHVDGQNLYNVVVHEIGHSLGLQHSSTPGSAMWPWTKDAETQQPTRVELNSDDIRAVQRLYGDSKKRRFQRNENSHFLCRTHVDALMTVPDDKIYAFNGAKVSLLSPATLNEVGELTNISSVFPFFPNDTVVDAALYFQGPWSSSKAYLFVAHKYYRYSLQDGSMINDTDYPKNIIDGWGLTDYSFGSVFTYENDNTLVFVKGDKFWYHTGTSDGSYPGYPQNLSDATLPFKDLGGDNGIDAAFLHKNGTNYLLSNEHVYMLDHVASNTQLVDIC